MNTLQRSLLWSILAASSATAGPLDLWSWKRQDTTTTTLDCSSNSKTGIQAACWTQLDVPGYIDAWIAENGTAAGCDTLGFAQCYLQYNGYTGLTCDDITSNTCPPFDTADPSIYSSPQQFYTLWNIYTVYQVFNSWSASLYDGAQLASGTLDAIVAAVSPPTDANSNHSIIASLIASSLYFMANFLIFAPLALPAATVATAMSAFIVGNVATAFSMTSTLMSTFAGGGSSDARFITLAQVGSSLTDLVVEFQQNLSGAIGEIQGNSTMFLAMTKDGYLSTRVASGTISQTVELFRDLQLYVLSASLAANGIISARSTGVDPVAFAAEVGTFDCPGYGPAGNCYQFWYDEEAGNTYALHNPSDWTNSYAASLDTIFNSGWANLSEIFKVEDCQGAAPALDPTTLQMTCLSSHKLCEWNYQDYVTDVKLDDKQWTDCDNDGDWWSLCNNGESIIVPQSYLGPLMKAETAFCKY